MATKSPKKPTTKSSKSSTKSAKALSAEKSISQKVDDKESAAAKVVSTKQESVKKTSKLESNKKNPKSVFEKLNMWNWVMALLHFSQGAAVISLSADAKFPLTTTYLTVDNVSSTGGEPVLVSAVRNLADVNLAYLVAAFFFLSAAAHLCIATVYRKKYEHNLDHGINKARWFEYSASASVMMVGISMLAGVSDLSTLILIFGATSVMNLLGLMMEIHNQTTNKTNWLSFLIGTKVGLLPWIAVALYLWGANQYGEGTIPTFVYYIFGSMLVFFSSFAVNMYLQYKKVGKWSNYLYGEKAYMILSLVAKSALAWQVFAGTLRP